MNLFGSRKATQDAVEAPPISLSEASLPKSEPHDEAADASACSSGASDLRHPYFREAVDELFADLRYVLHSITNAAAVTLAQARAAKRMNLELDLKDDLNVILTAPDQAPYLAGEILHEIRAIHPGFFEQLSTILRGDPGDIGALKEEMVIALKSLGVIEEGPELDVKKLQRKAIFRGAFRSFLEGFTLSAVFSPYDPYQYEKTDHTLARDGIGADLMRSSYHWNREVFLLFKSSLTLPQC